MLKGFVDVVSTKDTEKKSPILAKGETNSDLAIKLTLALYNSTQQGIYLIISSFQSN